MAFPKGQKYATGSGWDEKDIPSAQHWVIDGHGNRVDTSANFRGYLRDLEIYIEKQNHVRFYNSGKDGAFIKGTTLWEVAN